MYTHHSFPNVGNIHWVTVWLDTRTRSVTAVDSIHTSKVFGAAYVYASGYSAHLIGELSSTSSCQY